MIVCFRDGQTMERAFWDWHELYEKSGMWLKCLYYISPLVSTTHS